MTTILCLAHYCDSHGPTPLMVTEGLPVVCPQCAADEAADPISRSFSSAVTSQQPSVADALRKLDINNPRSSSAPAHQQSNHSANKTSRAKASATSTAPADASSPSLETPPQSPHRSSTGLSDANHKSTNPNRDSSFRRTYDDTVTRRQNPCVNCALTLPKRQDGGSGDKNGSKGAGPTLRTRAPYARVLGTGSRDVSPPSSNPQSSATSDVEDEPSPTSNRPAHQRRPTTSTTRSSSSRSSHTAHTHYLDYTSTHEPLISSTYSIVRASCLRTLSFETLPRRPDSSYASNGPTSPMTPMYQLPAGAFSTGPTPQSTSGGPIFFGDPLAGYTTAYIFRIPDVHARGRKRVYAFLALSTHRERLAMKTFSFISAAFRDLAAWIQDLAEAEAELEREREEGRSGIAALNAAYGGSSGSASGSNVGFGGLGGYDGGSSGGGAGGIGLGGGLGGGVTITPDREASRAAHHQASNSESSFASAGGRAGGGMGMMQRMGGSMGPRGFAPKARGLAELVGMPDFFIELHARFVKLLLELGVVLSS